MSNNSLISRIEAGVASVRSGYSTAKSLAECVRINGRAMEGVPYPLIKEVESLAISLDIAASQDEDGFVADVESILVRVETWVRNLPRSTV